MAEQNGLILITGAAGFIGSCLAGEFNRLGNGNLILVDDFSRTEKSGNFIGKECAERVDREVLFSWLEKNSPGLSYFIHLGARTDTAEQDKEVFDRLNLNYSKKVWNWCTAHRVPLIYASSAATYGDGHLGYSDSHELVPHLKPLNPYGVSKNDFDIWALLQEKAPPRWSGLKFFNVYGPNEYHKGRMASVVLHAFRQIQASGRMRLFKSHRPDYEDGGQARDFIYVKDLLKVILFLMKEGENGLYNAGTGKARTFLDLANAVFMTLGMEPEIEFIDTPADIRDTYQYYTCAEMGKLYRAAYPESWYSLEEGVKDYVEKYLIGDKFY